MAGSRLGQGSRLVRVVGLGRVHGAVGPRVNISDGWGQKRRWRRQFRVLGVTYLVHNSGNQSQANGNQVMWEARVQGGKSRSAYALLSTPSERPYIYGAPLVALGIGLPTLSKEAPVFSSLYRGVLALCPEG